MNLGVRALLQAIEGSKVQLLDISKNDFSPSCVKDICRTVTNTPSLNEVKVLQCAHLKPEHLRQI